MNNAGRKQTLWLAYGLSVGLLFMGALRWSSQHDSILTPLAGFATPGYIAITAIFITIFIRKGLSFNKFGFGVRPDLHQLILTIGAILLLRFFAIIVNPAIEELLGSSRDLERFSDVEGSAASFWALMVANWTFAAFGEEFAYRIVLLRSLTYGFGDSRWGKTFAVILQAVLFGLIHAYQGPAGIIGSTISGLIFGTVTVAAGWSIWPAAIAHGINNTFGIVELYNG